MSSNPRCWCGHERSAHIYEQSGCRPGFECENRCEKFVAHEDFVKLEDMVNNPPHYKTMVPGVECIEVTENFNFCLGNAIKYIWRADYKGNAIQDLRKASWYIEREIERRERDQQ